MSKEKLYIFDTTLRDGAQTQGVDFSIDDKEKIALALDKLGVDYIEGGWPGANPTDTEFFQRKIKFNNSKLTAFGMTKRSGRSAENDPGLSALLNSKAPAICLVGKTWDFHVDVALGITKEENLENIKESAKLFVKNKKDFHQKLPVEKYFCRGQKYFSIFAINLMTVLEVAITPGFSHLEVPVIAEQFVGCSNVDIVSIEANTSKAPVRSPTGKIDIAGVPINMLFCSLGCEIHSKDPSMALPFLTAAYNRRCDDFW